MTGVGKLTLHGEPGWGSILVEAQLIWYGLDYDFVSVGDLFEDAAARARLEEINPLGQIPTLVSPVEGVLTESAAITLWLADVTGSTDLVPPPGAPERARFLRWLVFLVANVYPTYTYVDDPARVVPDAAAREGFKAAVNAYQEHLYRMPEGEVRGPWFLGERFSALDIYMAAMSQWTPGRAWFRANAPKTDAIAVAVAGHPTLSELWAKSYPES